MRAVRWLVATLSFAVFYLGEILVSNFRVARDVLSPRPRLSPGIVRLPLSDLTDRQILAYATLLTMTPGTLTLEVDAAARALYLHTLYAEPSPGALRTQLHATYEKRIRRIF